MAIRIVRVMFQSILLRIVVKRYRRHGYRLSWRKRGGQLKTWLTMLKEDLTRMSGLYVYGLIRCNREWLSLGITWTQSR